MTNTAQTMCKSLTLAAALLAGGCEKAASSARPSGEGQPQPAVAELPRAAAPQADAAFNLVLKAVVGEDGMVHYQLLQDEATAINLRQAIDGYASAARPTEPDSLKALLCNAYNANVLGLISGHEREIESVNEIPGFFTREIKVAQSAITLDDLHTQIRKLGDARIHGALASGTRSSPPLCGSAYTPERIDEQLNTQARRFVEAKCRVNGRGLGLSEIFKRYEDDFKFQPYAGAIDFVRRHASTHSTIRDFMRSQPELTVSFLPYDWRLNRSISEIQQP